MAGWTFDMWMNISGVLGVLMFLGSYWLVVRGFVPPRNGINRVNRTIGLFLLLMPLFLRWFLEASLLMVLGVIMAALSIYAMVLRGRT